MATDDALRVALALERSESLQRIQEAVRTFAGELGYDRFVLFSASSSLDELVDRIYWVEGDWFGDGKEVDARTYVRRCPVTRCSGLPATTMDSMDRPRSSAANET